MSPFDAQGQLLIVTVVALAACAGVSLLPLARLSLRRAAGWTPALARRALLALAFAPMVVSLAALVAVLLPTLLAFAGTPDHCHDHVGHIHLCFLHFADHPASLLALGLATAVLTLVAGAGLRGLWSVLGARRALSRLVREARRSGPRLLLASATPVCASVGLLRPRLLLSEGFIAALSPDELRAAVAHEEAHIAQRDALWRLLAGLAARLYPRGLRRELLATLDTTMERAADEHAARRVGDRLVVAQALVSAERAMLSPPLGPTLARSFGDGVLAHRVHALLADYPPQRGRPTMIALAIAGLAALVVALHEPLHHAVESLLGKLLH